MKESRVHKFRKPYIVFVQMRARDCISDFWNGIDILELILEDIGFMKWATK